LSVNGNISGSGTINITRAGTVEITGSATGTIAFGDGFADTLLLDTSDTSFSGTITGLRGGNSIDLTSLSWAVGDKTAYNATTHVLDIRNGAGTNVFQFNNISSSSGTFTVTSDGSGGTLLSPGAGGGGGIIIDPPCFLAGTRILTDRGEVVVEDLRIGDLVVTASGVGQPVQWIGRRTYISRRVEADRRAAVLPIRIMAGALDDNLPVRDLLLSPDHALLVDGVLIQAGAMVNAPTIQREDDVPAIFTYYHVELADHALILAEGVPAETFVDNVDRMAFDNWDEYLALYPEGRAITEMPLPRAKSHRQVPMATRGRLAARAASLLSQAAIAA
jgi:hypothetical protein